jgi:signal transduction histidine kinase
LFACHVFAFLWVVGDVWATWATSPVEKQVALTVLFTGSIPVVPTWWMAVRRYVAAHGLGRPWMTGHWAELPAWFAGAAWLFMLTNPWHGQFVTPVVGGRNVYHWGLALTAYFNYAVVLASAMLCGWAARRHLSAPIRRKMAILAIATLVPLGVHLLHVHLPAAHRLDPVAVGLGLAGLTIFYGISRRRLFSLLPMALPEVLEQDPAGLAVVDRDGRLLQWNAAAARLLDGISLEPDLELLRLLPRTLQGAPEDERLTDSRVLAPPIPRTSPSPLVFRYLGRSDPRWLRLSLSPISSRWRRPVAASLRIEDETSRQRAEHERRQRAEQLQRTAKLTSLTTMAGGVTHELNNVRTAIVCNVALALDDLQPETPAHGSLLDAQEATQKAATLLQQVHAFTGHRRTSREPLDCSDLVHETLQRLPDPVHEAHTVQVETVGSPPPIQGDPTQLRELVTNLVTNAAQAIGQAGGWIRLRTTSETLDSARLRRENLELCLPEGPYVVLEVADSGCGMDEETRRRAFEPFFTTRDEGRGLGLAAAAGIARAHRGGIGVQSELGMGASFRVWLPAAQA